MAPPTAHRRAQVNRWARITGVIAVAGPIIAELIHPWILQYPALGAIVGGVEVAWRALYPAQPVRARVRRVRRPIARRDTYGGPP